jgi:hypothetical protein
MLGHEWVDEIHKVTHTRCWSLGLKNTVSYIGNTVKKGKQEKGLFIKILKLVFHVSKKY